MNAYIYRINNIYDYFIISYLEFQIVNIKIEIQLFYRDENYKAAILHILIIIQNIEIFYNLTRYLVEICQPSILMVTTLSKTLLRRFKQLTQNST